MTVPLLEVENLVVRHGAVTAVDRLSFRVERGEIVGLIGPNGAGKSSTLHAVMGLVRPAAGQIRLQSRSIVGRRPEDIARLGFAARRGRGDLGADLRRLYDLFPVIEEARRRPAGTLSGGQQQQLAIARALVANPDVLLCDEPSLGLAPQMVDAVFDALTSIRERGLAVLLVEQRAQRTVALADRSHVLSNGRLRLTLEPKDAADTETMVAAYFA
jgi:branched-chain amino acid transport system ATP-binding protein